MYVYIYIYQMWAVDFDASLCVCTWKMVQLVLNGFESKTSTSSTGHDPQLLHGLVAFVDKSKKRRT